MRKNWKLGDMRPHRPNDVQNTHTDKRQNCKFVSLGLNKGLANCGRARVPTHPILPLAASLYGHISWVASRPAESTFTCSVFCHSLITYQQGFHKVIHRGNFPPHCSAGAQIYKWHHVFVIRNKKHAVRCAPYIRDTSAGVRQAELAEIS